MADKWLVDENIDVDIQQLKDFADAIRKEVDTNFRPSFQNGVAPMLTVRAPFGGGGLKEGAFFRQRHDDSRMAVSHLLGDVMRGLMALSTAAHSISLEYLTGDALSQATSEDVLDAFEAVDGQETLSDKWRKDGADPASAIPQEALNPPPMMGASCPTGDEPEQIPEQHRAQLVGEGSGSYLIKGDDEGMHGAEVQLNQSDLR